MSDNPAVIIKPALEQIFLLGWARCRVLLFAAPCGCGKTVTAAALLKGHSVLALNAADADFGSLRIPSGCDAVLVDDLQYLEATERQQALGELIGARSDLHFVLLGRTQVPGWLMPFRFAGLLCVIETKDLLLDLASSRRLLEARGVTVSPEDMAAIQEDHNGYGLTLEILCRHLAGGKPYTPEIFEACRQELFVYYDSAVFRRFEPPMRAFLVSLAPFEGVCLEFARMVSGEARAGMFLGELQRSTVMLLADGIDSYRFWPIFREFLLWEMHQTMTAAQQHNLYSRAALYYELHDDLARALDCYARAGDQSKVSEMLIKNAELHPGVGHYRELQDYYFALPEAEIRRSPTLICGMSMLTAMCLDYETSEAWYRELQSYAARLQKSDSEYRTVRGKLAYLDIALPQRGSKGLIDVIGSVFRVMRDKQLNVPSFSVTSTLPSLMNGGKDFCEWSKKDDLLYATMRGPVEAVLGRDGVGLADCAICESKFEKGEDVSRRLLTLMTRLGDIQARGTPDVEFAVVGLLARVQVSQGKAEAASESIESLRAKYVSSGETRFLPNIDAMLCRIDLRLGNTEKVRRWLQEKAPKNEARLWAMWRYQYLTRAMVQFSMGEYSEPLLLLARLLPYCEQCGRVMDSLCIRLVVALCQERRGDADWKASFARVLDKSCEYGFLWPVAQYGTAVLPLLQNCGWHRDAGFLTKLTDAARAQAVQYPKLFRPQAPMLEPLSAAEMQVLRLVCENLSNQEIGEILNIKLATVKTHVSHILQKLGLRRRSEARQAAEKLHLL